MSDIHIALIGNPNCGKTTLYNALTGSCQRVGNWPGVTVERKTGAFCHRGCDVAATDLPGVYTLTPGPETGDGALDAAIARDHLADGQVDVVLNVVDAAHLERHLYLTAQLLEMGRPVIVALNMGDVAARRGLAVDAGALAAALGCPVVPIVATRADTLEVLKDAILAGARAPAAPEYGPALEAALSARAGALAEQAAQRRVPPRWAAILEAEAAGEQVAQDLAAARYALAEGWAARAVRQAGPQRTPWTQRIDALALGRWTGIPVFCAVMYLLFWLTIAVGGAFIDFFDILVGTFTVDGTAAALAAVGAPQWATALIAEGVGGGVQTVATFIPIVGVLFLVLTFLEDCGYMARAAFVMDRAMRAVGLPGKAFVPMILGFGCTVPAVMAVRTLDSRRDRIATAMMAPFMSCGARLPVYALFAAAFFPVGGQNVVFALYFLGVGFAVLTGFTLKHTLLRGPSAPFIMELPAYHWPTVRGLFVRTWRRLSDFVFRAGKAIVLVVVVLSFFNSLGTDGSFGNSDTERSVLAQVGKSLTPVVAPMGLTEENWPATVALFTGIFAKEVVVGTLDALYARAEPQGDGGGGYDPWPGVAEAFASVPANLAGVAGTLSDPLGFGDGAPEVSREAFAAMRAGFDGTAGALAYLMIILLYLPCVAATAAILRETSVWWTVFISLWSTGLGWGAAVVVYQAGTFARHPDASAAWIIGVLGALALSIAGLRALATTPVGRRVQALCGGGGAGCGRGRGCGGGRGRCGPTPQ
jgi:ferrous iron transport protein B